MYKIPLSNIDNSKLEIDYVTQAVQTGWISSSGSFVQKAQEQWAKICGNKYCLLVNNGTAALHLSLMAFGVKPYDEIIVPGLTFVAPAAAVKRIGAKPIVADVLETTWCINPDSIKQLITPRTKGVIAVNLMGYIPEYDEIKNICKEHNLFLIEDAAQSHGSSYRSSMSGSFGDISTFSFFANKTITSGEGGAVLTQDENLYQHMSLIMNHGMTKNKPYWHDVIGDNFRTTNLNAAFLCAQIERINEIVNNKKHIDQLYRKLLFNVHDVHFRDMPNDMDVVIWLQAIFTERRDELVQFLRSKDIDARSLWYPIIEMPLYGIGQQDTPISRKVSKQVLWLPTYSGMSNYDISYVADMVMLFFAKENCL